MIDNAETNARVEITDASNTVQKEGHLHPDTVVSLGDTPKSKEKVCIAIGFLTYTHRVKVFKRGEDRVRLPSITTNQLLPKLVMKR